MLRKFKPFDERVIIKELGHLSTEAFNDLTFAMDNYQSDTGLHYRTADYGGGVEMIAGGQGRCLFFNKETAVDPKDGELKEMLVILLVYKKESDKAPKAVVDKARERLKRYEERI